MNNIINNIDYYNIKDALSSKFGTVKGLHKINNEKWPIITSNWLFIGGLHKRSYIEPLDWTWNNTEVNLNEADSLNNKGYKYKVRIPLNYNINKQYPLMIILHGGIKFDDDNYNESGGNYLGNTFANSANEDVIIVTPNKIDVDWQPLKLNDIIYDVIKNCSIDINRIYLSGLSMGGRGTFIVCSELQNTFAAIAPLAPHHLPTDYTLLNIPNNIPVFLYHSINDNVSQYEKAIEMKTKLENQGTEIRFVNGYYGHSGWVEMFFGNSNNISWLLSKAKN